LAAKKLQSTIVRAKRHERDQANERMPLVLSQRIDWPPEVLAMICRMGTRTVAPTTNRLDPSSF
jgi:hypothetical protein